MGKGKGRKVSAKAQRATQPPQDRSVEGEDRRSLAVTVAWTTSALATVAALLFTGLAWLLRSAFQPPAGEPNSFEILPGLLLFTALATGSLALLLTPVVYRLRVVGPPKAITIGVLLVAALPWLVLLGMLVG